MMDSKELEPAATADLPPAAPAVEAAAPAAPAAQAAPGKPRGFFEWFTRRKSLAAARAARKDVPLVERERLQRARIAAELADRALDPIDPLRSGPGSALAISLYREAAYFAILGQDAQLQASNLAEAWQRVPADVLLFAAGSADGLTEVRRVLVEQTFADSAFEPEERAQQQARLAKAFVYALLDIKLGPERAIARFTAQRWVRSLGMLALLIGGGYAALAGISAAVRSPDLAAGKPWKASSQFVPCNPAEHKCGDARTDIFFHTNEDDHPWLQIDLQKPTEFSVIEVVNRRDCCPDRAFPLAFEVSQDGKTWREIARQPHSFYEWKAKVAPVTARYIRTRALKKTWLHLERVTVRAK